MEKNETKTLTLYDGCILMLLFGIAVSVFTPGLIQASEEKKLSDMVDRLQIIRTQIMLYQAHHDGLLPGQRSVGDSVTSDAFTLAMKQQQPDGSGPYLREIFENPYVLNLQQQNAITCVNDARAVPTGSEGTGWWFNAATGDFFACDSQFHMAY